MWRKFLQCIYLLFIFLTITEHDMNLSDFVCGMYYVHEQYLWGSREKNVTCLLFSHIPEQRYQFSLSCSLTKFLVLLPEVLLKAFCIFWVWYQVNP